MAYEAESPRLYLQRLTVEEHLDDFFELWNNDEGTKWSAIKTQTSIEETRDFMIEILPAPERNPETDKYAILLKPLPINPEPWLNKHGKPKMIGMVGTNRWSAHGMEAGYCMNVNYWGKGYGGEGFRLFLETFWGLAERKNMNHLVAKIDLYNEPSQRLVQRAGARQGEVMRERYTRWIDEEGAKKRDARCWYLDRPGWEERNLKNWEERDVQDIEKRENEAARVGDERIKKMEKKKAERDKEGRKEEYGGKSK